MQHFPEPVSFIGIVDFSQDAKWLYMTDSVTLLLGYEPRDLIGRPSLELVHPDEYTRVKQLHYDTITQDKAAVLVYLRMKHKNPDKGYVLCGIIYSTATLMGFNPTLQSRTVVHNVLVGSVSFASPGAKALHNASTAQEITIISPVADSFQIKRWHDPLPSNGPAKHPLIRTSPRSPVSTTQWSSSPRSTGSGSGGTGGPGSGSSDSESESYSSVSPRSSPHVQLEPRDSFTFDHLPNQSLRTLFILDRFSLRVPILYCSNDLLVTTTSAIGRSFFDFVAQKDEDVVRNWIDCVKGWGVNDAGGPSDGGFGFGRFTLLTTRRDSSVRVPEPPASRSRRNRLSRSDSRTSSGSLHHHHRERDPLHLHHHHHHHHHDSPHAQYPHLPPIEAPFQIPVDAIFSAHSDGLMVILRRSLEA